MTRGHPGEPRAKEGSATLAKLAVFAAGLRLFWPSVRENFAPRLETGLEELPCHAAVTDERESDAQLRNFTVA